VNSNPFQEKQMSNENNSKRNKIIMLGVALFVILVGNLLAFMTQTDWGNVKVRDVRFVGTNGIIMSALLYEPKDATAKNPAPGILAIHGYINSRETQDGFAIEFARRGYVVLAIDETGHGYSDPPAFANGFGGIDGLSYLRSLDIVDKNNIGLEGHSMGGWAIVSAAAAFGDTSYKSMVLEGSAPGVFAPPGTPTFPKNVGVVYSKWDEFALLMWGVPKATDITHGDKLKQFFGTQSDVVVGRLYGNIANGTARALYQPTTTHPGDHISTAAIGDAINWFQITLQGGKPLPPSDQIWYWKEIGNLIALIGMILLFFPVGALLLRCGFFREIEEAPAKPKSATGISWWIAAVIFVVVPALTWFPFTNFFTTWKWAATPLFPQNITTQVMIWALLVAAIAAVLFLIWHFAFNRKAKATASDYGLTWGKEFNWRKLGKSFLLAFLVAFAGYLTLVFSAWLFNVDFRFWVFAVKPMSNLQFQIFLGYLIPFIFVYLAFAVALHGQLRPRSNKGELSQGKEMAINWALMVVGFILLLLVQYIPLLTGHRLGYMTADISAVPLWSIIAFQFLPLMTIVSLLFTFFYRRTGHIYTGVFASAMVVVWIIVASEAIHFALPIW
jgi:pimeloyl-ACP methyl ester carboxylesterase